MKSFLVASIRFYRNWISPAFPPSCRFFPTCSTYAMEAVERNGVLKGSVLAVKRLLKCHPWRPGGFDPVPPGECVQIDPVDGTAGRQPLKAHRKTTGSGPEPDRGPIKG